MKPIGVQIAGITFLATPPIGEEWSKALMDMKKAISGIYGKKGTERNRAYDHFLHQATFKWLQGVEAHRIHLERHATDAEVLRAAERIFGAPLGVESILRKRMEK